MEIENVAKIKNKPVLLSYYILKALPNLLRSNGELYKYNNKYYEPFTKELMGDSIFEFFEEYGIQDSWSTTKEDQIVYAMQRNKNTAKEEMDTYTNLINLNNGVYNFETKELFHHSPKYYFSYKIDVDYDPKAPSPIVFMTTLRQIFSNDEPVVREFLKMCGYIIYPQLKMEKFFLLLGSGRNGKSMLLDVLQSFFPREAVTSLSLALMARESAHQRSELLHSKLNISAEEKQQKIDAEQIKRIVSGQDITIDPKFKKAINFRPKAKLMVDSNNIPYFSDSTYGTLRRMYIFKFPNRYVTKAEIKKEKFPEAKHIYLAMNKDEHLKSIFTEKSGIFNVFLKYLNILRKDDNWIMQETYNSKAIMAEYLEAADTLTTWLNNHFFSVGDPYDETPEEDYASVPDIFNMYRLFYSINLPGQPFKCTTRSLGAKIREIFSIQPQRRRQLINGYETRVTFYKLKPKDEAEEYAHSPAAGTVAPHIPDGGEQEPLL